MPEINWKPLARVFPTQESSKNQLALALDPRPVAVETILVVYFDEAE